MRKFLFSVLATIPTIFVSSQSLSGVGNGTINIGQSSLPLVFHISSQNGESKCLLDSPNQGAKGIVSIVDYLSADSISLRIPAIKASYNGKLNNGQLKGTFFQSGMKIT